MAQHVRFVAAHKYYVYVRRRWLLSRCTCIGIIARNMYYKHPRLAFIILYYYTWTCSPTCRQTGVTGHSCALAGNNNNSHPQ